MPSSELYDSTAWQVLEERTFGDVRQQYVWSPVYVDAMVLRDRDANDSAGDGLEERLYVTHDANFNVTALTDTAGDVVERFIYDPYGQATVLDANWAADADGISDFAWQYLHQGGRYDAQTGLYHFRFRDYSPELGRWVRQDPNPSGPYYDGANSYQKVGGNPANFTDARGLETDRFGTNWDLYGPDNQPAKPSGWIPGLGFPPGHPNYKHIRVCTIN